MSNKGGKKERRDSTGDIEEMLKRKRKRMEQSNERGEVEDIFRKDRKTVTSPRKEKEGKGEIGAGTREDGRKAEEADSVLEIVKNEMRKWIRGVREEMKEMIKMLNGVLRGEGVRRDKEGDKGN